MAPGPLSSGNLPQRPPIPADATRLERAGGLSQQNDYTAPQNNIALPSPIIESRLRPKPARVELNGKTYEIIIKNHGSIENPDPAQAQKFATLFGITLQYGIAALKHQHKLSELEIKLKYIKIKKKTDGKLFLTYKDKKVYNKEFKIEIKNEIENALEIDSTDKEQIQHHLLKSTPEKVFEVYDAAIECFTGEGLGDAKNAEIAIYKLKIPTLSDKAKEIYDPSKAKEPKALNKSATRKMPTQEKSKNDQSATSEDNIEAKADDTSAAAADLSPDADESKPEERPEKQADGPLDSNNKDANLDSTSSASASSSSSITAKYAQGASLEENNPSDLSLEERELSKIPSVADDADNRDEYHQSSWKDYLLYGILNDPPIRRLPSQREQVIRSVQPKKFEQKDIESIIEQLSNRIDNREDLDEMSQIFLKRLLGIIHATEMASSTDKVFDCRNTCMHIFKQLVNTDESIDVLFPSLMTEYGAEKAKRPPKQSLISSLKSFLAK